MNATAENAVAFAYFYKFSNSPKAALRFPTAPFLDREEER
jgi:hypothetical protein